MAYNQDNKNRKVLKIQEIYLRYSEEGVTNVFIYEKYIEPVLHISIATFYNYLAINAKRGLKKD